MVHLDIPVDEELYEALKRRSAAANQSISLLISETLRETFVGQPIVPVITYEGKGRYPVAEGASPFNSDDVARLEKGFTK